MTRNLPFLDKPIRRALRTYTRTQLYLEAFIEGALRYDINGQPAGTVSEEEAAQAKERILQI